MVKDKDPIPGGFTSPVDQMNSESNHTTVGTDPVKLSETCTDGENTDITHGFPHTDMNGIPILNNEHHVSHDRSWSVERGETSTSQDMTYAIMPTNDVIIREFEEYVEVHCPHMEDEENKLRQLSIEDKWKLVFSQGQKERQYSVKMYLDNLRKHIGTFRRASLRRTNAEGGTSLSYWLRKLKIDMKKSPENFVEEFVQKPNNGMSLLLEVLKQIHKDQEKLQSIRKSKVDHIKHALLDEYDCLLCIKFALVSNKSVSSLLESVGAVEKIAFCILCTFRKTTVAVVEILTLICDVPSGFLHVTDAITALRVKAMESVRFKLLARMLHSQANRHFQAVCVRFFNKLLSCTDNANAKVYLQHELEQAGFEPDSLDRYSIGQSTDFEELHKELEIWRKNYINVDLDREELYQIQNRCALLREEIDRLQSQTVDLEATCEKEVKTKTKTEAHCDKLREHAAEIQDMLGRVTKLYRERVGEDASEEIEDLDNFYKPIDGYATVKDKFYTVSTISSRTLSSIEAVNIPPPAPPLMPPSYLSTTVRRKVGNHVSLPTLNWTPMYSVRNTLFEDIDDEAKLRDIDFREFDRIFELPTKEVESRDRGDRIVQRAANLITFIEHSRARNMIITIKRTGLSCTELRDAVDTCQLEQLPGEYAELLLKYVPTKEELTTLAQHASEYHQMGEAEKNLFQLTKVKRLERKLSLIAFMGKFDDIINVTKPEMEVIQRSSESLLRSMKLKKVFELLLAFGNYMNSVKKGYAVGFKLESLSRLQEVKSGDKSQTLLHYLAHYIETKYPELVDFHLELDLCVEKGVSYQSVASDVLGLRRGMDLLRFEMEKQHHNKILSDFHQKASPLVVNTADRFRKMEEVYKNTCVYLGEDYRHTEPDELIKYMSNFVASFKKAIEENYKRNHPETPTTPYLRRKSEPNRNHKEVGTQIPTPWSRSTVTQRSDSVITSRSDSMIIPRSDAAVTPRSDAAVTPRSDAAVTPRSEAAVTPRSDAAVTPRSDAAGTPRSISGTSPRSEATTVTPKSALLTSSSVEKANVNLNTPSKSKPESSTNIIIDAGGTKVPSVVNNTEISPQQNTTSNTSVSMGTTDDSEFVTMIKVTEEKDMRKLGAGQYSELPFVIDKSHSAGQFVRRSSSISNTDNIRIPDSYSFFYGAKMTDNEPLYAKVRKNPSMKEGNTRTSEVTNLRRNPTAPPRTRPQMIVRRHMDKGDSPPVSNHSTPKGRLRSSSAIKAPTDPIYEDIPAGHMPQPVKAPPLPNGFHKVNSANDSATTNSPSSVSTTPTNTPSISSDDSALRKTYPITSVNGLPDTPDDSYDLIQNSTDKDTIQDTAFYNKQVDDVIDSLNQVLNDAYSDVAVAGETENSYL